MLCLLTWWTPTAGSIPLSRNYLSIWCNFFLDQVVNCTRQGDEQSGCWGWEGCCPPRSCTSWWRPWEYQVILNIICHQLVLLYSTKDLIVPLLLHPWPLILSFLILSSGVLDLISLILYPWSLIPSFFIHQTNSPSLKYFSTVKIRHHKYYQWVCFTLYFQAILFYIPRFLIIIWIFVSTGSMWLFGPLDPSTRRTRGKSGAFCQNKIGARIKKCDLRTGRIHSPDRPLRCLDREWWAGSRWIVLYMNFARVNFKTMINEYTNLPWSKTLIHKVRQMTWIKSLAF